MKRYCLAMLALCVLINFCSAQNKPVIIGYIGGYKGLIDVNVSPKKLSVINYAFVDVKNNRA